MPDFVAEPSNKTIHQWLEKLLSSKNFVNVNKALKLFTTIPVTSYSCDLWKSFFQTKFGKNKIKKPHVARKIGCNDVDICRTRTIASQINYDDVIDEFRHFHSFDKRLELY